MSKRKPTNPFYILLLLAGCAFSITACAYGVMTVRQLNAGRSLGRHIDTPPTSSSGIAFNELVDRHGAKAMTIEIIVLGIGTLGAIAYDQRLDKAATAKTNSQSREQSS